MSLRQRNSRLEPPDAVDTQPCSTVLQQRICPLSDGNVDLAFAKARNAQMKAGGNHSDNREVLRIEPQALAYDVRRRSQLAPPESFAHQRDGRAAHPIFSGM